MAVCYIQDSVGQGKCTVNFHLFCFYFFYLFGFCSFQHCIGHIMASSFMGRRNQYIQLVKVLYCKLLSIGKQLSTFPHTVRGLNHRPRIWKASVVSCATLAPVMFQMLQLKRLYIFNGLETDKQSCIFNVNILLTFVHFFSKWG